MNMIEVLNTHPAVNAIGWALVHFLWQGTAIAAVVAIALRRMRQRSANARYLLACVGMAAMLAAPLVTIAVALERDASGLSEASVLPIAGVAPSVATPFTVRVAPLVPGLTLLWFVGTILFQFRCLGCWLRAQRLRTHATRPLPPSLTGEYMALCAPLAVRRHVRFARSTLVQVPMVIGWLRPVILLPVAVLGSLTPPQLKAVVAHELAHVRRHDYLVNLFQAAFESLLFFHPLVWWLSSRIRAEREFCCDDLAARVCGDTIGYARALARLDELRADTYEPALAATGGSLMQRITRLIGVRAVSRAARPDGAPGWLTPVVLAGSLVAGISAAGVGAPDLLERHREHDHERQPARLPERASLEQIDLVAVVRDFDAHHAEMLAMLREAGFANHELAALLEYFGADKHVMGAIDRAAGQRARLDALGTRLDAVRAKIDAALAAGKITEEEAFAKRAATEAEIEAYRARLRDARDRDDAIHHRARKMAERGMTREEIQRALEDAQAGRAVAEQQIRRERIEVRVAEVKAHLAAAVAGGKLTQQEADERLDVMMRELAAQHERAHTGSEREHEHAREVDAMRARGMHDTAIHERHREGGLAPGKREAADARIDRAMAHMRELKARLGAEVDAGRLTEEQARAKLEHAHESVKVKLRELLGEDDTDDLAMHRIGRDVMIRELRERGLSDAEIERELHRSRLEMHIDEIRHKLAATRESGALPDDVRHRLHELEVALEQMEAKRAKLPERD